MFVFVFTRHLLWAKQHVASRSVHDECGRSHHDGSCPGPGPHEKSPFEELLLTEGAMRERQPNKHSTQHVADAPPFGSANHDRHAAQ